MPITKDEYKSRLTYAIARGAHSGYHQRLDTSDYGEYHFKMVLCSSNDNRASTIFCDCPACLMMMLAFIWLMPSFERTSYYTLLP